MILHSPRSTRTDTLLANTTLFRSPKTEVDASVAQNGLLADPVPVRPLLDNTVDLLRQALNAKLDAFASTYEQQKAQLEADADWNRLSADQQASLKAQHSLSSPENPQLGTAEAMQAALEHCTAEHWVFRNPVMPSRFEHTPQSAVKL